jgi:hypothetical protein
VRAVGWLRVVTRLGITIRVCRYRTTVPALQVHVDESFFGKEQVVSSSLTRRSVGIFIQKEDGMKPLAFLIASIFSLALFASVGAASPHFVEGPTFTDVGSAFNASGKIAGLGNEDVTVTLTAVGVADTQCRNKGGNVAPGQDTTVTAVGEQIILDPKNGNVVFNVTTDPVTVSNDVCPNGHWTAEVVDVTFTSATLTVEQGGEVVLSESF